MNSCWKRRQLRRDEREGEGFRWSRWSLLCVVSSRRPRYESTVGTATVGGRVELPHPRPWAEPDRWEDWCCSRARLGRRWPGRASLALGGTGLREWWEGGRWSRDVLEGEKVRDGEKEEKEEVLVVVVGGGEGKVLTRGQREREREEEGEWRVEERGRGRRR